MSSIPRSARCLDDRWKARGPMSIFQLGSGWAQRPGKLLGSWKYQRAESEPAIGPSPDPRGQRGYFWLPKGALLPLELFSSLSRPHLQANKQAGTRKQRA
jgi:hypothetical protein